MLTKTEIQQDLEKFMHCLKTKNNVLFGFKAPADLSMYWQFTDDAMDESKKSYKQAVSQFQDDFDLRLQKKTK